MIFTFLKMALKFIGSSSLLEECGSKNKGAIGNIPYSDTAMFYTSIWTIAFWQLMLRSIDPILIYRWKGSSKLTKNLTGATSFKAYKIYIELQLDIIVIWKHCSVKQLFTFHNGEVFSLYMGMKIPCWVEIGMGKFPHSSLKAHNIFPIHGLAVIVKRNFPIRGFAAHGEIYFHYSC